MTEVSEVKAAIDRDVLLKCMALDDNGEGLV